jgi:hypothetical protein
VRTAVIGQGPASLAAAWAVRGLDPSGQIEFFGPDKQSPIRGAVVLHEPIPGVTLTHPDGYVRQLVVGGHIDDYGRKLYGDIHVNRHGDPFRKGFHTWRVDEMYDYLWGRFASYNVHVGQVDNFQLERITDRYDFVINTAPANLFCVGQHEFRESKLDLTWELMHPGQQDNTVVYNADPAVPWARSASIFGSVVTEWAPGRCAKQHHTITKPLGTDCDCHPDVFRAGRYGAWDNLSWIETAYYGTRERMLNV